MLIRKLRLQRGWSQSQLADMVGVTTRTIQRLEKGQNPALETARALAAVFEVDLTIIRPEDTNMNITEQKPIDDRSLKADEQEALLYAKRIREFYEYLFTWLVLAAVFFTMAYDHPGVYILFGATGLWGIYLGLTAFGVIKFLQPEWERKLVEKKLGRKL